MFFWVFFGRWHLTHKHSFSIYVVLFLSLYVCAWIPHLLLKISDWGRLLEKEKKYTISSLPLSSCPCTEWVTVCVCDSVCVSKWEPMHEHFFHSQNQWSCKHSHSENPSLSLPLLMCFLNDSITESIVSEPKYPAITKDTPMGFKTILKRRREIHQNNVSSLIDRSLHLIHNWLHAWKQTAIHVCHYVNGIWANMPNSLDE